VNAFDTWFISGNFGLAPEHFLYNYMSNFKFHILNNCIIEEKGEGILDDRV